MVDAARTKITLIYNGVDISADISKDLTRFEYTDNASGKVDDLQITLQDREGLWRGEWFPEKGARLTASIEPAFGGGALFCGSFEIDEIEVSGPPQVATIKAVSAPVTSSIRGEKKTRAWEGTSLEYICSEIALGGKISLFYDAGAIKYDRVDQRDESDLAFMERLCKESGLNLKVGNDRVVVYDEQKFEGKKPVLTIDIGAGDVSRYTVKTALTGVYRAAEVKYRDPNSNVVRVFVFEPEPAPKVGKTLKIRRRVDSLGAARDLCRRELRNANKGEFVASFSMPGHPAVQAGQNIVANGMASLSGTYHIETARHSIDASGGYTCEAECHRILSY
jgi:phage protein D